jgi:hypothetical protein
MYFHLTFLFLTINKTSILNFNKKNMFIHNTQVEKVHKPPLLPYSCGKEIKVYAYGTGKS